MGGIMKKIAFYLPQYHSIPENDKWWGKGFTEWTNVKSSKPQFYGHFQPEIPYNENYYNLLNSDVQKWQAELATKYGIDGFCYYHYWFEGKLLLEKPMENMLKDHNINLPFCICWANESWARTWDGCEKNVLIKQNYSEDIIQWKAHFEYLLKFFKDDRYILDDSRPLLIIYKPYLINNCKEMLSYWRRLAIQNGFKGLYIGAQYPRSFDFDFDSMGIDFGIEFEPLYTMYEIGSLNFTKKFVFLLKHPSYLISKIKRKLFHNIEIFDYDMIWNLINNRIPVNRRIAAGAFPSWDNSPRKGKRGTVFFDADPVKFEKYFYKRICSAKVSYGLDYIFINAWNEWGEGAHLEPDARFGHGYLEAIKKSS